MTFHTIVVTSPDAKSAEAAQAGPLHPSSFSCQTQITNGGEGNPTTRVISTSDPFNCRMGSGGGTLAALDCADSYSSPSKGSTLIIHAGGESSRCPTQMTLGKAWTSLPTYSKSNGTTAISNPTHMLVTSLTELLRNLPDESVVVAASDVLLSLPMKPLTFGNGTDVVGLAVPAPLATATNHGVFVVKHKSSEGIVPIAKFLQKPSIEEMRNTKDCELFYGEEEKKEQETKAWIDTGVVIFLPRAAARLRSLARGYLKTCTQRGIEELYKNAKDTSLPLEEFAKVHATKVELYSHILLAFSTSSDVHDVFKKRDQYLTDASNRDLGRESLEYIHDALSDFELQVCLVPEGQFIHLGTTRELKDFLIHGSQGSHIDSKYSPFTKVPMTIDEIRCREFGSQIGLVHRANSHLGDFDTDKTCVILNTVLEGRGTIKPGTLMEHCKVISQKVDGFRTPKLNIGPDCLISGMRGILSYDITIPPGMVFQMVPLDINWNTDKAPSSGEVTNNFVYIYVGVNDPIKKHETCYGLDFQQLILKAITPQELWKNDDESRLLWNARIHPVCNGESICWKPLLWINAWIHEIQEGRHVNPKDFFAEEKIKASLELWRSLPRLSLSEIRKVANASSEYSYRNMLRSEQAPEPQENRMVKLRELLEKRQNEAFDFNSAIDEIANQLCSTHPASVVSFITTLETVATRNIEKKMFDISSRALMLLSDLMIRIARIRRQEQKANLNKKRRIEVSTLDSILDTLRSSETNSKRKASACAELFQQRKSMFRVNDYSAQVHEDFADVFEKVAFALTEVCITNSNIVQTTPTSSGSSLNCWVVSSAPARVDLSGGWSDTPPISYEFGGAVACIAVTVDGRNPLAAKCRKLGGSSGISLRTESRDSESEKITDEQEVHLSTIDDLADYRDPMSSCALLKCALIALGVIPEHIITKENMNMSIQPFIDRFCNKTENDCCSVGIELVSTSFLPRGSGMGSSSILGGCVLSVIAQCIGIQLQHGDALIKEVLHLEQLLTTGGGWQDQVGGLIGGLKIGRSAAHQLPLSLSVQKVPLSRERIEELNQRLVLAFTGQPRLARNILQKVLRRWARRNHEIVTTVKNLVDGANDSVLAIQDGDFDRFGSQISAYWEQKKSMAGEESGVEPPIVKEALAILKKENIIVGGTLCGAGGGGFLALLLQKGKTVACIDNALRENMKNNEFDISAFTWHKCEISEEGVRTVVEE